MIGIYKIINKINGKCYIGQSTQIEKRWSKHKNTSHNQTSKAYDYPLYRAFRKYGIENFSFEILEECSNLELNEKEKYWINYYNPEYNYQYNSFQLTFLHIPYQNFFLLLYYFVY